MKNTFKIIGIVILAYIVTTIIENLFIKNIQLTSSIPSHIITDYILVCAIFLVTFSLFWILFLRDKNVVGSLFRQMKLKKAYFILITLCVLFSVLASVRSVDQYKKSYSLDDTSHFVGNSTYENSKYHFKFTYPEGSVFAHAHPEYGFVTRFFLPNGESIGNDEENIGMYIKENSRDLETEVKYIQDRFSKNGPIDIKEVQFGGQKGYRIILTTDYSAQKGTKELFYITVRDGIFFELNYFPVAKNISVVDTVASSFTFTQ